MIVAWPGFTLGYETARSGEQRAAQQQCERSNARPIEGQCAGPGPAPKKVAIQSGHHEPSITENGGPVARVLSVESSGFRETGTDAERAG